MSVYLRAFLLAGGVAWLLNTRVVYFDEELFIAIFSCVFFIILYYLTGNLLIRMFFIETDRVYINFAFLLHLLYLGLNVCIYII